MCTSPDTFHLLLKTTDSRPSNPLSAFHCAADSALADHHAHLQIIFTELLKFIQARINWEGCVRKGILGKNGGDGRGGGTNYSGLEAVHPDCWCIYPYYLHFAPENPEDGEMYLLVPAHPGCPGQSPEMVVKWLCVCVCYLN